MKCAEDQRNEGVTFKALGSRKIQLIVPIRAVYNIPSVLDRLRAAWWILINKSVYSSTYTTTLETGSDVKVSENGKSFETVS